VPTTLRSEEDAVVDKFIARYGSAVTAVLSGFDRLVFRGTLLPLVWERDMHTFLGRAGVRLLDFKQYAVRTTERLIARSMQEALNQHRPILYLPNSKVDKEALAPPAPRASAPARADLHVSCARAVHDLRVPPRTGSGPKRAALEDGQVPAPV
jgi:hypothetical protein